MRAQTEPYRMAGTESLDALMAFMGPEGTGNRTFTREDFEAGMDPGYGFRQEQGEQAINRSVAARTGLLSGHAGKEIARFNQGLASNEYAAAFDRFRQQNADRFGRLAGVAGSGQNAATQYAGTAGSNITNAAARRGGFLTGTGQQAIDAVTGAGNAAAAGDIASGNAWASGLSGGLSSLQQMYLLSQMMKTPQDPGSAGMGNT
jgi:hypothetical protein